MANEFLDNQIDSCVAEFKNKYNLDVFAGRTYFGYDFVDKKTRMVVGVLPYDVETKELGELKLYETNIGLATKSINVEESTLDTKFVLEHDEKLDGNLKGIGLPEVEVKEPEVKENIIRDVDFTIENVDDITLATWANYVINKMHDINEQNGYEKYKEVANNFYEYYFTLAMSSYYDYVYEKVDSSLPDGVNKESIKRSHANYRESLYKFNSKLENSDYFKGLSFSNTFFRKAILLDNNDEVYIVNGYGEVFTKDNKVITLEDRSKYIIYIPKEYMENKDNMNIKNLLGKEYVRLDF